MLLNPDVSIGLEEPAPPRRRSRRARMLGIIAAGVLLVMVAIATGAVWQITRGALDLGFLRSRIEDSVRASLPPDAEVAIGSAALSYDAGLVLKAHNVRVQLPGTATVEAGEFTTVANFSRLISGDVDLQSITMTDVGIGVSVQPRSGAGAGGAGPAGNPERAAERIRNVSAAFSSAVRKADAILRGAGLRDVTVRNTTLFIDDGSPETGSNLKVREARWQPSTAGESKAWVKVDEARGGAWDLTITRQGLPGGETSTTVEIANLSVAALAPALAADDGGPFLQSTLAGQANLRTDRDGAFVGLEGALTTADGLLSVSGKDRIQVRRAMLNFGLGREGDSVAISRAELRTATGNVEFAGAADLSEPGETTLRARIGRGILPSLPGQEAVPLTGGDLAVRLDHSRGRLDIEQFDLAAPGGTASVTGAAILAGEDAGLTLAVSISEMPAAVLRALWPPFVGGKTRAWFDANVKSGTIGPGTLNVVLPAAFIGPAGRDKVLPPDALLGSVPFRDAEFLPLKTFPAVRGAAGEISFADATATVRTWSGTLGVPERGDVQAGGTELAIPELGRERPRGDLDLVLSGPAGALAALANTPPFSIAAKRGIQPEALSGDAQLTLATNIPLDGGNMADAALPSFRLALVGFASPTPIDGRKIEAADIVLEGTARSFTVKGDAKLDGLQAAVDLVQGSAVPDQTAVKLTVDDAARERIGLSLGGVVTGPVEVSIAGSEAEGQRVALDLNQTRISLAMLGWEKGVGVPATAEFTMHKGEDGIRISDLELSGKGFGAKGSLSLSVDGKLRELVLRDVALRPGDEISARVTPQGSGFDVQVQGRALDARGIIRGLKARQSGAPSAGGAPAKSSSGAIRVSLDVRRVTGQDDVVLSDVAGSLVIAAGGPESVALKGKIDGGEAFEWTLGKEGKTRALRVFADNAGALIRFTGIYNKVVGGNLILDYSGPAGGEGGGVFLIRDFQLRGESALTPAVETARQAANDRAVQRAAATRSGDLSFSQLRVPFRQNGWVILIDDAALRGALIGATASGTINVPDGKMAISGTFIPAFGINNIAGAIPIIGTILGGGRDEGLLGITYKLFGPLDGPKLVMNPVSAIAPGIFRKIFEYR